MKKIIIAIDGYSSCGKSTFAKLIAKELGYIYVDSGAMYRAVTLYSMQNSIIKNDVVDKGKLISSLDEINITFKFDSSIGKNITYLNGVDVEDKIRTIEVSNYVSIVSKIEEVRKKMIVMQKHIGREKGIVMEGRDIGSVVFPGAELKIFLTASSYIRAMRRYNELKGKGEDVSFDIVKKNIEERDRLDETRSISPLVKAPDAIILDNSNMNVDDQMKWVMDEIKKLT